MKYENWDKANALINRIKLLDQRINMLASDSLDVCFQSDNYNIVYYPNETDQSEDGIIVKTCACKLLISWREQRNNLSKELEALGISAGNRESEESFRKRQEITAPVAKILIKSWDDMFAEAIIYQLTCLAFAEAANTKHHAQ